MKQLLPGKCMQDPLLQASGKMWTSLLLKWERLQWLSPKWVSHVQQSIGIQTHLRSEWVDHVVEHKCGVNVRKASWHFGATFSKTESKAKKIKTKEICLCHDQRSFQGCLDNYFQKHKHEETHCYVTETGMNAAALGAHVHSHSFKHTLFIFSLPSHLSRLFLSRDN